MTDLVPKLEGQLATVSEETKAFAATTLNFQQMIGLALRFTTKNDWIDQDGKPYLQATGSEKLIAKFGLVIKDTKYEREEFDDEMGRSYLYTYSGTVSLPSGASVEAIGTCSTRDKFFGKRQGKFKPIQDVDIASIKKKAYTNFLGNGITRLLGLRGLTWENLKGGNIEAGSQVTYKKQETKNEAPKEAEKAEIPKQDDEKKPIWKSKYKEKIYIFAKSGSHFSDDFLNLHMRSTKTPGVYSNVWSEDLEGKLEDEFLAAEERKAMEEF